MTSLTDEALSADLLTDRDLRQDAYSNIFGRLLWETAERTDTAPADFRVGGRASKKWPDRENVEWWLTEGFEQTEKYLDWMATHDWVFATMPDGRPGIEWDAEVVLPNYALPIRLIIDAVYQNAAGELIVVDYKSGTHTPSSPEQLGLYATALEVIYGPEWRPRWGSYFMTRKAELVGLKDLSPWGMEYFGFQFNSMDSTIAAGYFAPSVDDHCSWCSFAEYCPAVAGDKSSQFPLVIGS